MVTGHEGVTYLDEIGRDNDSTWQGGDISLRVTSQQDQLLAVHSEMLGVRRYIHELHTALETNRVQKRRDFEMMQAKN